MYQADLTHITGRHLDHILQRQAEHNSQTDFLISDEQYTNFAADEDCCNRLANGFYHLGIRKRDC